MEYRREVALVFSLEEALQKLNSMRAHGFSEFEIHVFAKNIKPLLSLKMYPDIHVHKAGNLMDQFWRLFSRGNLYEVCLRSFDFSKEERAHYGHGIEQGAYFLIAEHEHPLEKQPNKVNAAWKTTNATD
ncbi:general stress protein [Solibacillus daqui]|uniref:general stress protein n=1 Tax=Solibacillus daqui TaxID=2912187 RepID=UPI0023666CA5|nr:general stress protein [Solibacillus daqui]